MPCSNWTASTCLAPVAEVYGRKLGSAIYDAIRSGSQEYARALMSAARSRAKRPSATGSTSSPTSPTEWTGATGSPTLRRTLGVWVLWSPTGTSSQPTE